MTEAKSKDRLITPEAAAERLGLADRVKPQNIRRTIAAMGRRAELEVRWVSKYLMVVERSVDQLIAGGA